MPSMIPPAREPPLPQFSLSPEECIGSVPDPGRRHLQPAALSPLVSRSVCPRLHLLLVVVCRSDCIRDNRLLPEKHNCGSQYPKQRVASPHTKSGVRRPPATCAAAGAAAAASASHLHADCLPTALRHRRLLLAVCRLCCAFPGRLDSRLPSQD